MFILLEKPKPLTAAELSKAAKRFEWLVSFLICRYHFVHRVLGTMIKVPSEFVPTMGVRIRSDGKLELSYSPRFVNDLKDGEATYVFYHEVLHVVLHHCTCRQSQLRKDGKPDELWAIAIDLAVNELIDEIQPDICSRPRDEKGELVGCFVSEFKKDPQFKDIQEKQSAEWYYDYLRKKQKKNGGSKCGKCKGKAGTPGSDMDDHSGHKEHELAEERIRALVKAIDNSDGWGSIPETTKEVIRAAQIKKINWRNLMRTWFGYIAWKDRMNTRKRPNRRTGYIFPGTRKSYVDRWLVAADTSGSIGEDLLAEFAGVLNQLAEELPIDFMQFDCEKTVDPKPYERKMLNIEFKGRGGTDFEPVIKIANERFYKGVLILTDGIAAAPEKPRRAKVLWVLPVGCNPPVDWGDRVHLERNA